jgi:phosphate:Na+ symporter
MPLELKLVYLYGGLVTLIKKMPEIDFWLFISGLGIFLLGIGQMELGIKNLAGKSFRAFLKNHTRNPFMGMLIGVLVTAILQSSSVVSLMVLAFVGAGIIPLRNAIGIIFGANLGTTATGWLVATLGFKMPIESFALPLLGLGGIIITFLGSRSFFNEFGRFLVGFGALFLGINFMKNSIDVEAAATNIFETVNLAPHFFFIIGVVLTALIQSSSAAMVITLSALYAGIISLEIAGAIVIGGYLGTTVTVVLGTLKSNYIKKQVALAHVGFNFLTSIVALILLYPLLSFIKVILPDTDVLFQLVAFHSSFTLIGIILMLPFIGPYSRIIQRMIKDDTKTLTPHLSNVPTQETEGAIEAIRLEGKDLVERIKQFRFAAFNDNPTGIKQLFDAKTIGLIDQYKEIQQKEGEIISYFLKINNEKVSIDEGIKLHGIIHGIKRITLSAKNIKNVLHTINTLKESDSTELILLKETIQKQFSTFYDAVKNYSQEQEIEHLIDTHYHDNVGMIYRLVEQQILKTNELTSFLHLNSEIKNFKSHFFEAWTGLEITGEN